VFFEGMSFNAFRYRFLSPAKNLLSHSAGAVVVGVAITTAMFWATRASLKPTISLVGAEYYTQLEGYASVVNVAITIISVGIAWGLFAQAEASRKLNRKADVIISCIDRYERLSDFESQFGDEDEKKAIYHFSQYFALKSDQVDFYLAGWIDSDTFITWMRAMLRSWIRGRTYYGMTISEGWNTQKDFHESANAIFFQLMAGMTTIVETAAAIDDEVKKSTYVDRAFRLLIVSFYDRTRAARRLLATDFEPNRYFETRTKIVDRGLTARLTSI